MVQISNRDRPGLSLESMVRSQDMSDFQIVKKTMSWRDRLQIKRPSQRNGKSLKMVRD